MAFYKCKMCGGDKSLHLFEDKGFRYKNNRML